ncbi:LAMI_0H12882g1_1 [Lachancea mirantina]|uniref:LAMI_0H12882g1_1 n=1 Tax=Lachancea mirantina TaxID=1230905 RepID=A0A1G4KHJ1_9SACH|nr:LAMI_0H12882g1_1 [Lachancea mirantina]
MSDISASEYLERQKELEDEARDLMPWDPKQCTYTDGSIRQQIFACLDCGIMGVCYSCSIQCHSECELVELFVKRNFTCDCGTERQSKKKGEYWCQLRRNCHQSIASLSNRYGQNYEGKFCSCSKPYNPESDVTMLQCLLGLECNEDWYHCCCLLQDHEHNDERKAARLAQNFPSLESFDAFICWKCVKRYASTFEHLSAHELADRALAGKVYKEDPIATKESGIEEKPANERKRRLEENVEREYSILLKSDYATSLNRIKESLKPPDKLYVFLNDVAPFLINDDPIYELQEDEDEASTYELGTEVIGKSMDSNMVFTGLKAMDEMKVKLSKFLKPFADSGKVVKEEDIRDFFNSQSK